MLDGHHVELVAIRRLSFPAGEKTLQGTLFLPAEAPRAAVVLNPATGVAQRYYGHFANWLAAQRGIACLTYDYSDFGESASGDLRRSTATMSSWALVDQPAARAEMRRQLPGVPLWVIGHSLGAMMMPLQRDIEDIARMIGVASGIAYHRDHPWPYQALARMFWFGHAPLATWALGYLPGKRLGFGADLPPKVYWEWRRWCISLDFFFPELGDTLPEADWSRCPVPAELFAFSDDPTIPPPNVWRLKELYGPGRTRENLIVPAEHGLKSVGHLGAFAARNAALWPVLLGERD